MQAIKGDEMGHGEDVRGARGLAVGADQKTDSREGEVSSVGVSEAEGHTAPLCEGVPLWSVWRNRVPGDGPGGGSVSPWHEVVITRVHGSGVIEVANSVGGRATYESADNLREWRERVDTEGERAVLLSESRAFAAHKAHKAQLVANNEALAEQLRSKCAEVEGLRLALDSAPVAVEVAPWQSEKAWSARWRDGARLIVGPKRASEGEAWWDASIAAGELARGRVPSVSEVDALVVGLVKMGDDWRNEVCPVSGGAEPGHVSKSEGTADDASVSDEARAVYRALSDARDAHAADSWAQLAEDAPGLAMVAELAAWFAVALEGEAAGRSLDDEADRVAVGLVLARAWLARSDAAEVREVAGIEAANGLKWAHLARVFACARTLSGLGGES